MAARRDLTIELPANDGAHINWPGKYKPRDMTRLQVGKERRELLDRLAMEVFVDMTNYGYPFYQCISAVFLSGMRLTTEIYKDGGDSKGPN